MLRRIGAVDAVTIELPWTHFGQIAMPDIVGTRGQANPLFDAVVRPAEKAKLYCRRILGKKGKIGAASVPRGAEGIRMTRPNDFRRPFKGLDLFKREELFTPESRLHDCGVLACGCGAL
jgi:hypothetical protein